MGSIYTDVAEQALRGKSQRRDNLEHLCSRVGLLAGMDRVLMTMHFKNGTSFRQIAKLTGISAAGVGRRINKLTRRLLEGKYLTALRLTLRGIIFWRIYRLGKSRPGAGRANITFKKPSKKLGNSSR
jgi:hypothetical protein